MLAARRMSQRRAGNEELWAPSARIALTASLWRSARSGVAADREHFRGAGFGQRVESGRRSAVEGRQVWRAEHTAIIDGAGKFEITSKQVKEGPVRGRGYWSDDIEKEIQKYARSGI